MEYTSGIYKIENKLNGKVYIGRSVNPAFRFYKHKQDIKNGEHGNQHLTNAVNKDGIDNFDFEVIEWLPDRLLGEREEYWIHAYDAANRDYGYNKATNSTAPMLGQPGAIWTQEAKDKASKNARKAWNKKSKYVWKFIDPLGEAVTTNNLNELCDTCDLSHGSMARVHRGEYSNHQGWRKYSKELEGKVYSPLKYKFIDPEGAVVEVEDFVVLAEQIGTSPAFLGCLYHSKKGVNSTKGWRRYSEELVGKKWDPKEPGKSRSRNLKKTWEKNSTYEWELLDPEGKKHTTNSLNRFCEEHKLPRGNLYTTLSGGREYCHGWRKYSKELEGVPFKLPEYKFLDPDGNVVVVGSFAELGRRIGAAETSIHALYRGKNNSQVVKDGWRRYSEAEVGKKYNMADKFKAKYCIKAKLISPTGEVVDVEGVDGFCKKNKLNAARIHRLIKKQQDEYLGWTRFEETK